ncbi:alkaline serine protease (PR1)/allergen F18-like protein [Trichoderma cornu-damae]|uniref:Alkaline serine protease (PR1)/allergen F18-like protein n=1 Tax=Trichoderma cornu-damae TaxID=654480 RepID=A0A9P8TRD8_9HYPO|nr:alkaline serine protease (PR1)/allergen F18-like protein [Trichoderma cornu-damae]
MAPVHTGDVVPGQWLVLLKPYSSASAKNTHLASVRAKTEDTRTPFHCETHHEFDLLECRGYSAKFDLQTKDDIEKMDGVLSVEPVRLFRHCQRATQKNSTWGLDRISHPKAVKPSGPYEYSYRSDAAGQGTTAYILDTGINAEHSEFEGRASRGQAFVTSDTKVSVGDTNGHGTHVAGTIGGKTFGVAKKVNIVSVKVFDDGRDPGARTDDIVRALQWVKTDARGKKAVVNMSLGGGYSEGLNAAVASLVRGGIIVCVAAGNETRIADSDSPASEPLAITVGAIDKTDILSEYSNYGRSAVMANGYNHNKVVDVLGPGTDITSAWIGGNDATETISGTSMAQATPHVTGLVNCLLSDRTLQDPDPYGVMSQITIKADKNKILGLDHVTSNSIIQV